MDFDFEALLQNYLAETNENLEDLEDALLALEQDPTNRETIALVFRKAHSIKSDASCLSFDAISDLAHVAEDLLDLVREGELIVSSEIVSVLLRATDALRELVQAAATGEVALSNHHRRLMDEIRGHVCKAPNARPSVQPPADELEADETIAAARLCEAPRVSSLRVTTDKLDRMLNLAGEIAVARGRVAQLLEADATPGAATILEAHRVADGLSLDLQEEIMRVRMVPIGPCFRQYARSVRDLAHSQGKAARLHIEGADVEVDTSVVDHLREPLAHMVRNAVDHGLERPEERQAAGKDPYGRIVLRARHQAGTITIEVCDDGRGLSRQRIAERAVARGLTTEPERLSDLDIHRLIFESGFSTASAVTEISGRGVGLDIVRRSIEALRGSISIESTPGKGTTISIRLPLTLAIIAGFAVGVGEETYVIPLDAVVECLEVPACETASDNRDGVLNVRGEALPYLRLRRLFGVNGATRTRESIVVVRDNGKRAGIAVDALHGESQTVIKPLGKLFQDVPGVSGSAVLANGRVALILDPPGLLRDVLRDEV